MAFSSDSALDAQFWNVTFIGGTADIQDSPPEAVVASTTIASEGARLPLAMAAVGDRVWIVQIKGGRRLVRRLTDVGIVQGREVTVISRAASGSVIVALQGCRIGLGAGMAHRVVVTTVPQERDPTVSDQPSTQLKQGGPVMPATTVHLGALTVGQSGRILGYEKTHRAYREKLLSMGLTPGTHFRVTRQAPMGDPIEIEVRGFKLSLRKGEAAALQVETIALPEVSHD